MTNDSLCRLTSLLNTPMIKIILRSEDHINGFDYLLSVNPEVKIYFPSDFFGGAPIQFRVEGKEKEVADFLPVHMRYFSEHN